MAERTGQEAALASPPAAATEQRRWRARPLEREPHQLGRSGGSSREDRVGRLLIHRTVGLPMPDDAHLVPGDERAEWVPRRGPAEPSLSLLLGASIDGENIDTKSGCSDERDKVGHST